jgi:hypothetical protein
MIDDELLLLIGPDGGIAGSSAYWLTADALLEEEAVAGSVQGRQSALSVPRRCRDWRLRASACRQCRQPFLVEMNVAANQLTSRSLVTPSIRDAIRRAVANVATRAPSRRRGSFSFRYGR